MRKQGIGRSWAFGVALSCALIVLPGVGSAQPFTGRVGEVLSKVEGLTRTCEELNKAAKLVRCEENVAKIGATLARGGLSPLEQKHLRMYQAIEWTSLAHVKVIEGDLAGAHAALEKGFGILDAIAPAAGPLYPRIRAMELYGAAARLAIAENNDTELQRVVDDARALILAFTQQQTSAPSTEYDPAFGQQLSSRQIEWGLFIEKRVSEYLKHRYGASTGDARAAYRGRWLDSIGWRLQLQTVMAETWGNIDSIGFVLGWGETAVEAFPLLREAGDQQGLAQLRPALADGLCKQDFNMPLSAGDAERRQRICSAL